LKGIRIQWLYNAVGCWLWLTSSTTCQQWMYVRM